MRTPQTEEIYSNCYNYHRDGKEFKFISRLEFCFIDTPLISWQPNRGCRKFMELIPSEFRCYHAGQE